MVVGKAVKALYEGYLNLSYYLTFLKYVKVVLIPKVGREPATVKG